MSFADTLIHTCTIQRAVVTKNTHGNKTLTYHNQEVGVSCRLMATSERILDTERAQHPTITDYKLFLPAGTDIQDEDQITDIRIDEEELIDEDFTVEAIISFPGRAGEHHIELGLMRVG